MERKVILYIATSLDGYIASPDDNLDFLSVVEQEGEDYGYAQFIETVDTVIVGRKTYDKVLSMGFDFPHSDKESYIITRTPKPAIGNIQFYTEDVKTLVLKLKEQQGKNIFVDGGAEVVNLLLKDNLIDEFCISIIPVLLGDGIRLFQDNRPELPLKFVRSETFKSGLIQVWYQKA
ncbi:dihydrofolate reductase family protein [Dyadobacter sp. CY345]|uniref:dihydrofolate reductase family protein n=1 Tax=Dyadobacter sp. CY345 TaxID=2909335 RepID=UPI001F1863F7|nr:dihydrofolate reductase family protein [Dyadobacter sp. CY345]MCF2442658.1 dihydrofolate reductase family protein [Dyadobacter sp. CY345]